MITVNKKKVEGIVLKINDHKDNNSLVMLLTKDGIENYIVRGTKNINSKLASIAQPLKRVEYFVTTNKQVNTVTEGQVIDNYTNVKNQKEKLLVAESISESIYSFSNHIEDNDLLYEFFLEILNYLKETDYPLDLLNYFDIKMWYLTGISPLFSSCPICNNTNTNYFSVTNGGNLCNECRTNTCYDEYVSNLLKIAFLLKLDKLNEEFLKLMSEYQPKINEIIKLYYREYLDYENFNRKLIEKLL